MKKLLLLFTYITLLLLIAIQPVEAHVLKTDGSIGAILHIQPDDNPKSGVETTYELTFVDTNDHFILDNCSCSASIEKADKIIDSSTLLKTSKFKSINSYKFQEPGVYTLAITGKPQQTNNFESFSITYIIRVEAGSGKSSNQGSFPLTLTIGLGLMISLIMLAAYAIDRNDKKDNPIKE